VELSNQFVAPPDPLPSFHDIQYDPQDIDTLLEELPMNHRDRKALSEIQEKLKAAADGKTVRDEYEFADGQSFGRKFAKRSIQRLRRPVCNFLAGMILIS
jgi:hypothetical protein